MDLSDIDVEVADRIGFELALVGLVAFDLRKAGDAVPLQAAMQRRARQVGDCWLQGVEAIVERQERMPAKGEDYRLLLDRKHCGPRSLGAGRQVCHRAASPPLGNRLRVDPVAPGQSPQARSTDRLC